MQLQKHILSLFCLCSVMATSCFALNGENYLNLGGSYRRDKITCTIDAYNPPDTLLLIDTLALKRVNIWEVNLDGKLTYCNYFVRGSLALGKVSSGDYKEWVSDDTDSPSAITTASVAGGNTFDGDIGIGYLYPVNCFFGIGPSAGWSYHYQRFRMDNAVTEDERDEALDNLIYSNRWNGPWIGFELLYSRMCYTINAGYNFTWPFWNASWNLSGAEVVDGAYSDVRNAHNGFAHTAFVNASYPLIENLDIALGFVYRYWTAQNGTEVPRAGSFADIGLAGEKDKVPYASWQSYKVQLSLNYLF